MSTPASAQHRPPALGPRTVADMLDTLAEADLQLATELDRIVSSRSPVSAATVTALERLLTTLRPAAEVRAQLAGVDRSVLAAAVRLRRRQRDCLHVIGAARDDQH